MLCSIKVAAGAPIDKFSLGKIPPEPFLKFYRFPRSSHPSLPVAVLWDFVGGLGGNFPLIYNTWKQGCQRPDRPTANEPFAAGKPD